MDEEAKQKYTLDLQAYRPVSKVERLLMVQKVVGSILSRDIPKVVKRWYQ